MKNLWQAEPTVVIFDEAAHLSEFREFYDAAHPVATQIIAVSSAAPSWFGDVCERAFAERQIAQCSMPPNRLDTRGSSNLDEVSS